MSKVDGGGVVVRCGSRVEVLFAAADEDRAWEHAERAARAGAVGVDVRFTGYTNGRRSLVVSYREDARG